MASNSLKALSATVSGLKQAMETVRQENAADIGKWAAASSYARAYNEVARRYDKLVGDGAIGLFDTSKLAGWADTPWPGQKNLFDQVYTQILILNNLVAGSSEGSFGPMYNLFVSGSDEAWQGQPFQVELSRCIREYTSSALTVRYGSLDNTAVADLKRFPCIFAYKSGCDLPPKFGFIRDVIVRQGQVRVDYVTHPVEPFLTAERLEQLSFELDIGKLELFRTHWAAKEVNLAKELHSCGITLPTSLRDVANPVDISEFTFDIALSFPGQVRNMVEQVAQELEKRLGPNTYFYDNNYTSQMAQPSLDIILEGIYKRAKLDVVFLSSAYQGSLWCGVEFRVVKDIVFSREGSRVMYLRTDDGEVEGVRKTDGYMDARKYAPAQMANSICERLTLLANTSIKT